MKLKDLILDRSMVSMEELSQNIGISRQTIYNIIDKKEKYKPSLLTIKKICKYFNVEWRDFVDEE